MKGEVQIGVAVVWVKTDPPAGAGRRWPDASREEFTPGLRRERQVWVRSAFSVHLPLS